MVKVKLDNLAAEIVNTMKEYTEEVEEGIDKAKIETVKEIVNHIKSGSRPKLTGRYLAGWSRKKVGTAQVVYNKDRYQLTHLLEKGHAKRGGGRVSGYPHLYPAEQEGIKYFARRVERLIGG